MKKKASHLTALLLTLGAVLCFAAGAAAADTLQAITAYLDPGITITFDGEARTLTDAKGARVYPITYNGSTYLPVRAVADLAGLEVNWDQATKTVHLGKMSTDVDLIDTLNNYYRDSGVDNWGAQVKTGEKDPMEISGINCSHWIDLYLGTWMEQTPTAKISFNLEGKYDTLAFQYYTTKDVILKVFGDNDSVLFEQEIHGGRVAQTVTVPLLKTTQLSFYAEQISKDTRNSHTYIFDAKLS